MHSVIYRHSRIVTMERQVMFGSCLLMFVALSCIPCTTAYCFNSYGSCKTWVHGDSLANTWIGCLTCCHCRGFKNGHCARIKRAGVCPRDESYKCQCSGKLSDPILCTQYPDMLQKCA